jgi:hypothetical protein
MLMVAEFCSIMGGGANVVVEEVFESSRGVIAVATRLVLYKV